MAKEQLDLRQKLETVFEDGDDDHLIERTTKAWCNRQNTIGAARNAGVLEEYEETYRNKTDRKFKWLPHF